MSRLANCWNHYWFRPSPLLTLAVCRLFIVGYQLYYLIERRYHEKLRDRADLPDEMYDPLPVVHLFVAPWGWHARPGYAALIAVYVATLLCGFLAFFGLFTNFGLLVFAAGNVFLAGYCYSFGDFHHPEGLMMIALVVLALSPVGGVLSIDDLRRRMRRNAAGMSFEPVRLRDQTSEYARWAPVVVRWIFALIYLSGAERKMWAGLDWVNGYTLQYYLLEDGLRWGGAGLIIGEYHVLTIIMSWMAIIFEATFFLVLIFPVLAIIYVPMGIGMHVGIWVTMRAAFFQYVYCYAVFVPWGPFLGRVSDRLGRRWAGCRDEVLYDGRCPLCVRSVTALDYLDWLGRLEFVDLERRPEGAGPGITADDLRREMHMVRRSGGTLAGFIAFRSIARTTPLLWPIVPLLWIPGAGKIGSAAYRAVAGRRSRRCDGRCRIHGS